MYRFARHDVALRQRAEADGPSVLGQGLERGGVRDIVPRHVFLDFILRNARLSYFHLHCAGGVRHFGDVMVHAFRGEVVYDFLSQGVAPYGAHNAAVQAELRYVVGEVGGCAADFLAVGQHVPKGLAHSYYNVFHDNIII